MKGRRGRARIPVAWLAKENVGLKKGLAAGAKEKRKNAEASAVHQGRKKRRGNRGGGSRIADKAAAKVSQ